MKNKPATRKAYAAERAAYIKSKRDVPCADCGARWPGVCMDFHHIDEESKDPTLRGNKASMVTRMRKWSYKRIDEELAKCVVLCACCHRLRHFDP